MLSQVNSFRFPSQIGERDRAREIRDQHPDKGMHLCGFPPHHDAEWTAGESPGFAKAIVEIPHVMLLHEIGIVAEYSDCRRRGLDLSGVVELHFPPRCLRRLPARNELLELRINLRRRDSLLSLRINLQNRIENLCHSLASER